MAPEPRWMTTGEVAESMGVSPSTVRRWLNEDRLAGSRIGKRWLVVRPSDPDMTVREAAKLLRAHPDTVRRWLADGRLPGYRQGRQWRIPREDVIAMVEGGHTTGYPMSNN